MDPYLTQLIHFAARRLDLASLAALRGRARLRPYTWDTQQRGTGHKACRTAALSSCQHGFLFFEVVLPAFTAQGRFAGRCPPANAPATAAAPHCPDPDTRWVRPAAGGAAGSAEHQLALAAADFRV